MAIFRCRVLFIPMVLLAVYLVGAAKVLAASLDLATAKLDINEQGVATSLTFSDGAQWPSAGQPAFSIEAGGQTHLPKSIAVNGDRWTVRFANGVAAEFRVTCGQGFAVFRLNKLEPRDGITSLRLFNLTVPDGAHIMGVINAGTKEGHSAAVMAAEPNVAVIWDAPNRLLGAETSIKHGVEPAAFGVIACPEAERFEAIARFEAAAGLPSPRFDGVWNKKSPLVKQSYFFLTDFRQSQVDEALALARRGGFRTILISEDSWSLGRGHYQVNRERFPDGLEGLRRTLQRFKEAGFRVGLHVLAASVFPPDPYLTPVPDRRLVTGESATLAKDIDAQSPTLSLEAAPNEFPALDLGGKGTVLRVGDELIYYGKRSVVPPFAFIECRRGYLGTKPSAHKKGDRVVRMVQMYGYQMIDLDTSLLDEVAGHFANVANACGIDMLYFDGSESFQGDHWYYNARLHKAFYDKLQNKNMLFQASSFSHYSWHLLARSASADGHGDLKGYLDERSGWFLPCVREVMPLDIGWYYGYDANSTPDEYEYILGATIGYESSTSFQVSCAAAAKHPFTGQILDLIAQYEKLRLSGRVSEAMRERLRIDPALAGSKTPEERARLRDRRRDYRLIESGGKPCFQRVVYEPWHEVKSSDTKDAAWSVRVGEAGTRMGVQIHVLSAAGGRTVADPFVEVGGKRWEWRG